MRSILSCVVLMGLGFSSLASASEISGKKARTEILALLAEGTHKGLSPKKESCEVRVGAPNGDTDYFMVVVDGADREHTSLGVAFEVKGKIEKTVRGKAVRYSKVSYYGGDGIGSRERSIQTWTEFTPGKSGLLVRGHDVKGTACIIK